MSKTFDTQAHAILDFYSNLHPDFQLGHGISIRRLRIVAALRNDRQFYKILS